MYVLGAHIVHVHSAKYENAYRLPKGLSFMGYHLFYTLSKTPFPETLCLSGKGNKHY